MVAIGLVIVAFVFSWLRWCSVKSVDEWTPEEVLQQIAEVNAMVPQLHLAGSEEKTQQFNAAVKSARQSLEGVDIKAKIEQAEQARRDLDDYFDGPLGFLSHLCWWVSDQRSEVAAEIDREVANRKKISAQVFSPSMNGSIALSGKLGDGLATVQGIYRNDCKTYEVRSQEMRRHIETLKALETEIQQCDEGLLKKIQGEIDALRTLVERSRGRGGAQGSCDKLLEAAEGAFSNYPEGIQGTQAKIILQEVRDYISSGVGYVDQASNLIPAVQAKVRVRAEQLNGWKTEPAIFEICTHPNMARDLAVPVLRAYMAHCGVESPFELKVDSRIKLCGVRKDGKKVAIDILTPQGFTPVSGSPAPVQVWISGIDAERTDGAIKSSVIAMDAMVPFCAAENASPDKITLETIEGKLPKDFTDDYRYKIGDTPASVDISDKVKLIPFSKRTEQNTHFIPVEAVSGRPAVEASAFTIKTENYAITKRIVMYVARNRSDEVKRFDEWMDSDAGLACISTTRFADQILNLGQGKLGFSFFFAHKSAQLDSKAERDLGRLESLLNRQKSSLQNYKIVVIGHASTCGSPASNQKYGADRALAIKSRLERKQIPMPVLAYSCGSSEPVLPDMDPVTKKENEKAARRNRRVEIFMVAPDGDVQSLIGVNAKPCK